MISFFRSIFQSKIGLFFTFAFVGLIAIAFASSDITGSTFGGVSGGNVASVGGEDIAAGDLSRSVTSAFEGARAENPTLDLATFVDQGGLEGVLDQMINGYALQVFGRDNGMIASKRLVDSEISSIGAFRGPDGQFSEQVFRQVLQSQGLTERIVRGDLERALLGEQMVLPVTYGVRAPDNLILPYASLILEGRKGRIALIPSAAYAPKDAPGDKALTTFYSANSERYKLPEQRTIRYAVFTTETLGDSINPTEEEIQAEYGRRAQEFAASETRSITQVITTTEAAANTLAAQIRGGKSLEQAAQDVGLSASEVNNIGKEKFARDFSNAYADAVFGASNGEITKPAQSPLGWHVARITDTNKQAARSLAQVRGVLTAELKETKTLEALADLTEKFEDEFAGGASLSEVASSYNLEVKSTPSLRSNGQAPDQSGYSPDNVVERVIGNAFAMEEGSSPQLAELVPGQRYAMYDVANIKEATPPPLAKIKDRVIRDYKLEQGAKKAKASSEKIRKQVASGTALDKAISDLDVRIPPAERVGTTRANLIRPDSQVPPPLALMFSMAEKTVKTIEAPGNQGWYVVYLDAIEKGDASKQPQLVAQTKQQFGGLLSGEYTQQFINAVKNAVDIDKDEGAIKAVNDQITGRNRIN